jgi:hypothetical protein
MSEAPSVVNCRWARETVRLPYPHWLNAEDTPWTCLRDPLPRPIEDPVICEECPRWQSRRLELDES